MSLDLRWPAVKDRTVPYQPSLVVASALFVQKRMGLGYTLNLGNPVSWLLMIDAVATLDSAAAGAAVAAIEPDL